MNFYALYRKEKGASISETIEEIKANKKKIDSIVFVNDDKQILPNTCYSYLRSFLEEAGLISKVSTLESKLLEESDVFFSQIGI